MGDVFVSWWGAACVLFFRSGFFSWFLSLDLVLELSSLLRGGLVPLVGEVLLLGVLDAFRLFVRLFSSVVTERDVARGIYGRDADVSEDILLSRHVIVGRNLVRLLCF